MNRTAAGKQFNHRPAKAGALPPPVFKQHLLLWISSPDAMTASQYNDGERGF